MAASVAHMKYLYLYKKSICEIYMFTYAHILVSVSKMFKVNSIEEFCFT